tara:strand:- start:4409 stop:5779 length:1371 start_codon:yes stop_codon:yes gene_type:complete
MLESTKNKTDLSRLKSGTNFLGILNDIKRRPEDAANELKVPLEEITAIIEGRKSISHELVNRAVEIWPVNTRDFYIIHDDCESGVKIMRAEESEKSSRVMNRAGKPYYEYRDTAMSKVAPFRPEWILELCHVKDNNPEDKSIQWNNGHFMHQFTYFIGDVNFYYRDENGKKQTAVMNTGDSMYITPFVSHTFATRSGAKSNGLILALTYGGKLTGESQQELSSLSNLGSEFTLDFSSNEAASASLLMYHRSIANLSLEELSKRTSIQINKLKNFEDGSETPSFSELEKIAQSLTINIRDLLPNDKTEDKVIVKHHQDGKVWFYPENTKSYEFRELASTVALPFSKAFEIQVLDSDSANLDLKSGLHQYIYNIGEKPISLNWKLDEMKYNETIHPGDSLYMKPFINHNFRGNGKLLNLRIGGKIVGDSQRELSIIGKKNAQRAISETMQWFDPQGKN